MFFRLDLIQSYGSGIRRAKRALDDNGSPKLSFSPDNDTDDYTLAIVYVNEEFARIQAEEEHNVSEIVPENVPENVLEKLPNKISVLVNEFSSKKRSKAIALALAIFDDHHITIEKMAQVIGTTDRTVKRYLKEFQDAGALRREGSDTSGEWILM